MRVPRAKGASLPPEQPPFKALLAPLGLRPVSLPVYLARSQGR